MPISVKIPTDNMMTIAINWSLAKCSCPSWSANADESALRSSLASLDTCNSSLHWWLGFWTFLVAFGVALEVIFVVWEYLEELHDLRRCLIHPPKRPTAALFVLGLLGAGLVAAGVSGEFWKESQIATVETCIRKGNDTLFLWLSKEAGDASASAKTAHEEAGAATTASEKAQDKAGAVAKQAEELKRDLLAAKTQLETVDAKRAELEKSLVNLAVCNAPRVIPFWSIGNKKTSVDPLKPFARQAIIEFVPDAETRRAASNIAGALDKAGWKIGKLAPTDGIEDGVEIQPFIAPFPPSPETKEWRSLWQAETGSGDAADALVDFLHSYNWQAKRGWPLDEHGRTIRDPKIMPPDSLRIRVGLYSPVTFVSPPGAKEIAEAIAQSEQEVQKRIAQTEKKRDEEIRKRFTPQQALEYKAQTEQWKEQIRLSTERYSGPCQPLNQLFPSPK
jgi:hypothetical protein